MVKIAEMQRISEEFKEGEIKIALDPKDEGRKEDKKTSEPIEKIEVIEVEKGKTVNIGAPRREPSNICDERKSTFHISVRSSKIKSIFSCEISQVK